MDKMNISKKSHCINSGVVGIIEISCRHFKALLIVVLYMYEKN